MAKIVVTESGVVTVGNGDTVIIDIPGGGDVTIVADPSETSIKKIRIEFEDDSHSDSVTVMLGTFNSDGLKIDIKDYDPTDAINLVGAYNTNVDPNNVGEFGFEYTGADGNVYAAAVLAKDNGEKDFTANPAPIIICFSAETELQTTLGWKRVDQLKPWDCVFTQDAGFQPVRWIGHRRVRADELAAHPGLRPIIVEAGALGHRMPRRRLRLSPLHRVLVRGWQVQMLFGMDEALVPVKALIDGVHIHPDTSALTADYYHVLLDRHAILNAEGCPAESLLMARQSGLALSDDAMIVSQGPGEQPCPAALSLVPARAMLTVAEGRLLAATLPASQTAVASGAGRALRAG
ncbi:Hint domain-containing protein [Roseivivax sp. CAU 1753]